MNFIDSLTEHRRVTGIGCFIDDLVAEKQGKYRANNGFGQTVISRKKPVILSAASKAQSAVSAQKVAVIKASIAAHKTKATKAISNIKGATEKIKKAAEVVKGSVQKVNKALIVSEGAKNQANVVTQNLNVIKAKTDTATKAVAAAKAK